jgi:hypothetical protein
MFVTYDEEHLANKNKAARNGSGADLAHCVARCDTSSAPPLRSLAQRPQRHLAEFHAYATPGKDLHQLAALRLSNPVMY